MFEELAVGFVEFRYYAPGKKRKVARPPTYLSLPLHHAQTVTEIFRNSKQETITVGMAPRCRVPGKGRMGKEHDVLQVGCVWATLEHEQARGGVVEIMQRIRAFPLRPSLVVNSGYSHQLYFVFHAQLRDHLLLHWHELMQTLNGCLQGNAARGISQALYLPGTLNLEEAYPIRCEISEEYSSWMRYSLDEVKEAIQATSIQAHPQSSFITVEQLRQRGLSIEVVEAIVTGKSINHRGLPPGNLNDTSGIDFQIAYALFVNGLNEEEIKSVFRTYPNGCGNKWAQKRNGEKYLRSLLQNVKARCHGLRHHEEHGSTYEWDDYSINKLPPGYALQEDGSIWYYPPVMDEDRRVLTPVKICNSPIHIIEIQENIENGQISLVISFDYLGKTIVVPVQRSYMSDARQLVSSLSGVGAPVTSINARLVTAYLAAYEHAFATTIPKKKVTTRFGRGRAGGKFFLPGLPSDTEYAPAGAGDAALYRAYASRRGNLAAWLDVMRTIADEGLIIPQITVLTALVPPLQRMIQIPNFILDLHGNTSTGKSTSLKLAASVYGNPCDPDSTVLQWMNTSVAVEQVAGTCSELPIFLDDAQHCPSELKRTVIYMIANGRGKGRGAGRGSGLRETSTWHTVALSTSEEPLHEASPHEGARGRILSIGGSVPPFRPGTSSMVQMLERAVTANHGYAGEAFIKHLNGWSEFDWTRWRRRYTELRVELSRNSTSDLAGRVGSYIAAIQLAAEVASPLLGLPFQPDVVGAWMKLHVDEQQSNQNIVLLALRVLADYYVSNINHFAGDRSYDQVKRATLFGSSKQGQFVGFLRSTIDSIFKSRKWNQTTMLDKMADAGVLYATEKDRHTKKISIEGVKHRMICIKWSALLPEDVHH